MAYVKSQYYNFDCCYNKSRCLCVIEPHGEGSLRSCVIREIPYGSI